MKVVKILAYYLPAFHKIPENDKWYGVNFTEWDNTKRAKPLFHRHNQPRIPVDYYDLSNVDITRQQMRLAQEYGIDGFVYYHYWFNSGGRMVLERPAEDMRRYLSEEEKVEYCFCWANQEWRKTWHEEKGTTSELLIEQTYGDEEDWNNHLNYLLPFFKDSKYIKVNNCPMFLIFRPEDIPNYSQMINYWADWAKNNGFDGIHFVRARNSHKVDNVYLDCDAIVDFEPNYTINTSYKVAFSHLWRFRTFMFWHLSRWNWFVKIFKNKVDYNAFINTMKEKRNVSGERYYYSLFVDWDNSPRKGKRGTIFTGVSLEKFEAALDYFYRAAIENESRYLYCFAWNEWGEGGYLEPDKLFGYGKLEVVKRVKDRYRHMKEKEDVE